MRNEFEFLIPIVFFASLAIVLYHFIKYRNSERMSIIEKGLSEEQLGYFMKSKKGRFLSHETTLKLAVILISVGLAILVGNYVPSDMRDATIGGLIFLLPGIGLLWVYKYLEKKNPSDQD